MGCVVNGPGEARDADIGIAAGNKRGHLFVKGTNVAVVPEDEMVVALVEWAEFIHEHGVEAWRRPTSPPPRRPPRPTGPMLLEEQGDDANASEQVVELIRGLTGRPCSTTYTGRRRQRLRAGPEAVAEAGGPLDRKRAAAAVPPSSTTTPVSPLNRPRP
jgi:hypothetical protein